MTTTLHRRRAPRGPVGARLTFVGAGVFGVLLCLASAAGAFGYKVTGKPISSAPPAPPSSVRIASHGGPNGPLAAEVEVDDGPADVSCVSRKGDPVAPTVEWEEPTDEDIRDTYALRDIPGSDPPRTEKVLVSRTVIRKWKVISYTCGGVARSVRVCVPEPGQPDTVCPPVEKLDGRRVALHNIKYASWRDLSPQFAPHIEREGEDRFAITQAPIFFWFPEDDWDYQPTAKAIACNAAGCLTATTVAIPIATGFLPGVPGVAIECTTNGRAITSAAVYERARSSKACHQYTYRHSSTTVGGAYQASVYMDYQINIGSFDEANPDNSFPLSPDPGNIWESTVSFDLKVGEIEAVSK